MAAAGCQPHAGTAQLAARPKLSLTVGEAWVDFDLPVLPNRKVDAKRSNSTHIRLALSSMQWAVSGRPLSLPNCA